MDILAVFANLIILTVALEISQGVARHYPDAQTATDRIAYASTALWFSTVAYALFAVFSLTFSKPLTALLLTSPGWEETFRVAVIAIAGNGIFFLLQNLLRWQLKPKGYAAASIAYVVISTGIGVWLVAGFHMGVVGVFYGQIVGAVAGGFSRLVPDKGPLRIYFLAGKMQRDDCLLRSSRPIEYLHPGCELRRPIRHPESHDT